MNLLTVKETAARLKMSISMVYRLISVGVLPCYEIGSCKRVGETELAEFLERHRKEANKLPDRQRRHF